MLQKAAAGGTSDDEAAAADEAARRAAAAEDAAYAKALARAMRLVNFRERSGRELAGRLLEDGYSAAVAARAVARMQELVRTSRCLPCGMPPLWQLHPLHGRLACVDGRFAVGGWPVPQPASRCAPHVQGLQDDGRYAQMYARYRWRTSVRAPAQIARVGAGGTVWLCLVRFI